jgi:hypothetical protein
MNPLHILHHARTYLLLMDFETIADFQDAFDVLNRAIDRVILEHVAMRKKTGAA